MIFIKSKVVFATIGWGGPLAPYGSYWNDGTYEYYMGLNFILSNDSSDSRLTNDPNTSGIINKDNFRDRSTALHNDDRRGWTFYTNVWANANDYYRYLGSGYDEYVGDDYNPVDVSNVKFGIQDGGNAIYTDDNITYNRYRRCVLMIYRRPMAKVRNIGTNVYNTNGNYYISGSTVFVSKDTNLTIDTTGAAFYDGDNQNQQYAAKVKYGVFHLEGTNTSKINFVKMLNLQTLQLENYDSRTTGVGMITGSNQYDRWEFWSGYNRNVATSALWIKANIDNEPFRIHTYAIEKNGRWGDDGGYHTFSFGGQGSYEYIRADGIKPSGTFSPNSKTWTNSNITVTFNPSDTGSGVKRWRYQTSANNGSTYGSWSSYISGDTNGDITISSNGESKIKVEVEDNVGNVETITSGTYQLDKTKPSGTFSPNSQPWTNSDVKVKFTPSDTGGSGIKQWRYRVYYGGAAAWGSWSTYKTTSSEDINLTTQDQYKLEAEVIDNAGNSNTITSGTYQIDKAKPSGTFSPSNSEVSILNLTVKFTPSDSGGSGVKSWKYRISTDDGTNWGGWNQVSNNASKDIYLSTIARCKIEAEVTDNAGNINTIKSGTYNIVNPEPVNGKLEMKKYDFQEYDDENDNGKRDNNESLKPIYWVKPESEFGIYTEGYFPSSYGIYPTRTYVLYAKDGNFDLNNSPRQYAYDYWVKTLGSQYDTYFYLTDGGEAEFRNQDNKNYISHTHLAQANEDRHGDKFKLYYANTYVYNNIEYYKGFVDSGIWLKVDGKPPTGNGLIEIDYKTLNMTITANDIKDSDSGVNSVWAMIYPDEYAYVDINDFDGDTEYKNNDNMKKKFIRESNGNYKLELNAYDDAFKSEKVKVVIYARDNVGNKSIIKEENVDLFTLKARIVPLNNMDYSSSNPPTLEEGQAAVLIMEVTGEAEELDIAYEEVDEELNKNIKIFPVQKYKRVDDNFIVPLYCGEGRYTVYVTAYSKDSYREASPEFIVSDSVLNGIKTRIR